LPGIHPGKKVGVMSFFHCSCGFAIDDAEAFADHLGWVFDRDDDIGIDGDPHAEINPSGLSAHLCACGFSVADPGEFNDHLLFVVIPVDGIGIDGNRHVLVDPATPRRWYARRPTDGRE
jgi:hypothetical protein